jgi:phage terminase large subunit-like protein
VVEPGGPAYRWVPGYQHTNGAVAASLGQQLRLPPDRNQQDILDAIFAIDDAGMPSCFEVAVVAPRQNLKTAVLQLAALSYLFLLDEELILWTAHLFDTSRKAFEGMRRMIAANPEYKDKCKWPPRTTNGDEAIELKSGQRLEFHARSKGAGRGFTGSKIILDEALFLREGDLGSLAPTLATMDSAQVLYASSAGMVTSAVLRDIRERGRGGGDPELAYWEFCAPQAKCAREMCPHVLDTPGCALDRRDLWTLANPALGLRITERRIGQFRRMMPPGEFRREFLGWWDDPVAEAGFPMETWDACADRTSAPTGRPVLAVDVSPGSQSSAIVAALERPDGATHLEVVAHQAGVDWVPRRAAELHVKQSPLAWVLDPGGPAGGLLPDLAKAGIVPVEMNGRDLGQSCESFVAAVSDRRIVHLADPVLARAISGAGRRDIGDGLWAWSRRKSDVDIAPLVAATAAHWGLATVERPKPAPASPVIEETASSGWETGDLMGAGF